MKLKTVLLKNLPAHDLQLKLISEYLFLLIIHLRISTKHRNYDHQSNSFLKINHNHSIPTLTPSQPSYILPCTFRTPFLPQIRTLSSLALMITRIFVFLVATKQERILIVVVKNGDSSRRITPGSEIFCLVTVLK